MDAFKQLPSVDQVLQRLGDGIGLPHDVVVAEIRAVLAEQRERVKAGGQVQPDIEAAVRARLNGLTTRKRPPFSASTPRPPSWWCWW